jgi:subtilase family serine protease
VRKVLLLAAVALGVLACASVAYGQTLPQLPQLPSIPQFSDPIVQQDFQLFQKLNIGGRFGIQFKSHIAVCPAAQSGEASCSARVITDKSGTPATQPLPAGYGPAQFLKAYGLTGTAAGAKRPVIAIVDAYDDPNIASDLATYDSTFGIPALPNCSASIASSSVSCFKKVSQKGNTSYPSSDAGWSLEISLDVEIAHATCENCSILLVEANSSTYANLMTAESEAVALGANVVSNSYGGSEFSGETSYDTYFDHPGVAFVASAGDSGYGVEYPAASRYVTAVGGTSLYLNKDGSYNSEVAWSGTGSGCSAFETKPSWQSDTGCTKRTVADVSADADPNTGAAVYDSVKYDGQKGWFQVGGTSLASPLVAATYALSGALPAGTTENSLPYLDPTRASDLHDVVSGSNGSCKGSYLCTASSGYDGPTGLGSPNGVKAF